MAEPSLQQIERYPGLDRRDPEPMVIREVGKIPRMEGMRRIEVRVALKLPRIVHSPERSGKPFGPSPSAKTQEESMSQSLPSLDQINIVSGDIEASVAFYRRLGVQIPESRIWRTASGAHHVGTTTGDEPSTVDLDLDSTSFARLWNRGWHGQEDLRGRVVVGFSFASREAVDATYGAMTSAGYRGLQPPYDAFWGARYAVIEDPDGVAVGLMSPITDEHRAPPPIV